MFGPIQLHSRPVPISALPLNASRLVWGPRSRFVPGSQAPNPCSDLISVLIQHCSPQPSSVLSWVGHLSPLYGPRSMGDCVLELGWGIIETQWVHFILKCCTLFQMTMLTEKLGNGRMGKLFITLSLQS